MQSRTVGVCKAVHTDEESICEDWGPKHTGVQEVYEIQISALKRAVDVLWETVSKHKHMQEGQKKPDSKETR